MSVKLLPNLPIEDLTPETDYLGLIEKGDLIASFLRGNKGQFNEIKMFSLYGEWGSGKSSLMKYLQKELKGEFKTYFFEAWEYEKDENLAFSLLEYIDTNSKKNGEPIYDDILKIGGRILRGLAKSVKINAPLYPNGPSLEFDAAGLVDEWNQKENQTFYKLLKEFKREFVIMESRIKAQTQMKYNIVFVDDLDRCEPEQVLNLLSAIKLFFTYGQRTIFFCGIDKKAVEEAVKTKYGEIVKANEYLEKIFDVSFSMPIYNNLLRLVNIYFDTTYYTIENKSEAVNFRISDFFTSLKFVNPRRVKKVLNKFQLLRNIKSSHTNLHSFPNIDLKNGKEASLFETLMVLYLIILHEFYQEKFDDFGNLTKKKRLFYTEYHKKPTTEKLTEPYYLSDFELYDISEMSFIDIFKQQDFPLPVGANDAAVNFKTRFVKNSYHMMMCPAFCDELVDGHDSLNLEGKIFMQEMETIDNLFYVYMKDKHHYLSNVRLHSNSTFKSLKNLISLTL